MRKVVLLVAAMSPFFMNSAQAVSVSAQAGKHYTELSAGLGNQNAGLAFNGSWARSDHDGQMGSLGATFGLPVGPFSAYVGGKGLYLSPDNNSSGAALAVGGGLNWQALPSLNIYGEAYGAPESLTSGSKSYVEAKAGARYTVFKPLSIDAGYRVIEMKGSHNKSNEKIADGLYLGAGLSF
ncbi:YfaZ family outer membrane protein [Providencia vermicola]|uniref:YfaZ family outer membrane protein n=1 Tax=Providencia vermicola TaxID=333965 RepID=UPI0022032B41|nr:YfaZ family protein [Providencia stuartii]